jgi:N-acetylglucosaminyldiphosphoundecaprenol N-acetyl-beta-D-mannosaminyltransferase
LVIGETVQIIGSQIDVLDSKSVVDEVHDLIYRESGSYVCVCNVHMCMEAFDSPSFQNVVNEADLVVADGKPLAIIQRVLGQKNAQQIRGEDLMKSICELCTERGIRVGLFGASNESILRVVRERLENSHENIEISYSYSPPFTSESPEIRDEVIEDIKDAGVGVLFVGIGCPKQEKWMSNHKTKLNCVMIGVGAAFDFISGEKPTAPKWCKSAGLEWLYRLSTEPRRLWKRYLWHNSRFICLICWHAVRRLLRHKRYS